MRHVANVERLSSTAHAFGDRPQASARAEFLRVAPAEQDRLVFRPERLPLLVLLVRVRILLIDLGKLIE